MAAGRDVFYIFMFVFMHIYFAKCDLINSKLDLTSDESNDIEDDYSNDFQKQGIESEGKHVALKRSSGQGIDEENPKYPYSEEDTENNSSAGSNDEELDRNRRHDKQDIHQETPDCFLNDSNEDRGAAEEDSTENTKEENENSSSFNSSEDEEHEEAFQASQEQLRTLLLSSSNESDNPPQIDYLMYNSLYSASDNNDEIIKLNKGIDYIVSLISSLFSGAGEFQIELPNINKTFGHGLLKGNFAASQGHFEDPTTIHRTGDVAIIKKGKTISLKVSLGLKVLSAGFDTYDLQIRKIHRKGTVGVSIAENSISLEISLTYSPVCKLIVDKLELNELKDIKVNITGLGSFQSMFDVLSKWLLDNFTDSFKTVVNQHLLQKAQAVVAKADICKYL